MAEKIETILQKIGFSSDQINVFSDLYAGLNSDDLNFIHRLQNEYMLHSESVLTPDEINRDVQSQLENWARLKEISPYTADLFFLISCLPELQEKYRSPFFLSSFSSLTAETADEMFYNIASDLTNKLRECIRVKKVWGTFVFYWFHRHFRMSLFALGRFQYEVIGFPMDKSYSFPAVPDSIPNVVPTDNAEKDGAWTLHPSDTVFNFHIPSCGPMPLEARIDSYRKAYRFFGFKEPEWMPLFCDSWLLWRDNAEIFPEHSNLRDFWMDFCLLSSDDPSPGRGPFHDDWRVFGKVIEDPSDLSALPGETSLQRSIIRYLEAGNRIGSGLGLILFDGQHILTRKCR